jgi:hypothetical protein
VRFRFTVSTRFFVDHWAQKSTHKKKEEVNKSGALLTTTMTTQHDSDTNKNIEKNYFQAVVDIFQKNLSLVYVENLLFFKLELFGLFSIWIHCDSIIND